MITLRAGARLTGRELVVPGDLSLGRFFLVAALLMPEANLVIHGVGLNPTRSALLDFLVSMGASIKVLDVQQTGGELIGDLRVRARHVSHGRRDRRRADRGADRRDSGAGGAGRRQRTRAYRARRLASCASRKPTASPPSRPNFRRMGVEIETTPDGFHVPGRQSFHAAEIDSAGDHRIAMAFAVAALAADGPCVDPGRGIGQRVLSRVFQYTAADRPNMTELSWNAAVTLSGLVHDLNNVFQTLVDAADLLAGDPRYAKLSAAILRSVERGKNITASIQAGNGAGTPFEQILANAIAFVEDSLAAGRGPEISFACDSGTRH